MFLCFFSLSSSMSANLYEQHKEIGILRAIGFTRFRIILLYSYEAFILVMSSSFLGLVIGTVAGFSMVAQFSTFIGMPAVFYFPFWQFVCIFFSSILCAALSTIGPTKAIVNLRISTILRGI